MAGSHRTSPELQLSGTLFHEHWWLSAVTGDNFREVTETAGGRLVGRLPFILARRKGFKVMEMPPFTRVLGPIVEAGIGKPQTRMLRRFRIVGRLLDQLPDAHYFRQLLDVDNHEVQAFLDRGFQLSIENTFRLDCRVNGPEEVWANMRDKTRNLIRKAEGKYTVGAWGDVKEFIRFYIESIEKRGKKNEIDFTRFPILFSQCRTRGQGEILVARTAQGRPAAAAFMVWGNGVMYYLLSARDIALADSGAVSLLIWHAIQDAHRRALIFDCDGITSAASFQFLSGFGGTIATRLVAVRATAVFGMLRYLRGQYFSGPG
jgi:Acetyltransferase (GNAT) domain